MNFFPTNHTSVLCIVLLQKGIHTCISNSALRGFSLLRHWYATDMHCPLLAIFIHHKHTVYCMLQQLCACVKLGCLCIVMHMHQHFCIQTSLSCLWHSQSGIHVCLVMHTVTSWLYSIHGKGARQLSRNGCSVYVYWFFNSIHRH